MEHILSDIPIINLPIQFKIQKCLVDEGIETVQDIVNFCDTYVRLMYIPGITDIQEKRILGVLAEMGVHGLTSGMTCEEWLSINYVSVNQAWNEHLQEIGNNHPTTVYKPIDCYIDDTRLVNTLNRAGLTRVGDLLIHMYLNDNFFDIKGIGRASSDEILLALDAYGLTKDIDLLDANVREYLCKNILIKDVDTVYTSPDTIYDMHGKGFNCIRDLALYFERNHTLKDFNRLMFEKLTTLELRRTKRILLKIGVHCK